MVKKILCPQLCLKEFLYIKAGVMTVGAVRFYSRKGCHMHTSEQVCVHLTALSDCFPTSAVVFVVASGI